jgi:hypothetical protein
MKKRGFHTWCIGMLSCMFFLQSCSTEEIIPDEKYQSADLIQTELNSGSNLYLQKGIIYECLNKGFFDEDIGTATCELTDFAEVILGYFEDFLDDPNADLGLINYYLNLNRQYVTHYRGENYYGADGEYNQLAKKRIRELKRFWELNRELVLNAQHTAWLNDRETLADMIESFDRTVRNRTQAYEKADMLLELNLLSPYLPESPYFAMEAFTLANGLMVIGDGLIETLVAAGVDDKVAFTAILAHEWWHQVQFENNWSLPEELDEQWERSRFIELEADFAAAYFMAHKRGATYNWKKIEEYYSLSYNVGDCLIESNSHHGTPAQRLKAAQLGVKLAEAAQKKGFILSPEELHEYFLLNYSTIIL